jgi:uncharacterized membrane protein
VPTKPPVKLLADAHASTRITCGKLEDIDLRSLKQPLRDSVKEARRISQELDKAIRAAMADEAIIAAERARELNVKQRSKSSAA